MNIQTYLTRRNITILVVAIAVVALGLLAYNFWGKDLGNKKTADDIKDQIRTLIDNNVENWELYQMVTDDELKQFGNDDACPPTAQGNATFMEYQTKALAGEVHQLELPYGMFIIYTPNYQNWSNDDFTKITDEGRKVCSPGYPIPLHAFEDKLVWGAGFYCEESSGLNCSDIELIGQFVKDHFANK